MMREMMPRGGSPIMSNDAGDEFAVEYITEPEPPTLMDRITGDRRITIAVVAVLVALALVSFFPLRMHFSTPDAYSATIATLDEKKANVLGLAAVSAAASAGLSAIPGDAGTPIAEKLIDLAGDFGIVLGAIYLEKYLLTIFGLAAFGGIFPLCCGLAIVAILAHHRIRMSGGMLRLAARLLALGLVLTIAIPASVAVTDMVDQTFAVSAENAAAADAAEEAAAQEDAQDAPQNPLEFLTQIPEMVADGVTSVTDDMLDQVNNLIEGLAVMIVTSCVIPIVVLVFFLWVANLILGVNVDAPMRALQTRGKRLAARPQGSRKGGSGPSKPKTPGSVR